MSKLKNKLYYYLVEKNAYIRHDYEDYVNNHLDEHASNKLKSWWILIKLNWKYRILRKEPEYLKNKPSSNAAKLPYLEGSESEGLARQDIIYFAKNLLKYDVISFDIFDTLILRPFDKPVDLFLVIGNRLDIMNFQKIRMDAERDARTEHSALHGNHEVTIYDIYEKVSRRTGLDVEKGVQAELQAEIDYCFANPYMMRVFKLLKEHKKKIIITSDMYLPHDMMVKLLSSCGYEGYDKLYVSCDYKCNKRNGGLFTTILHEFKGVSLVHIGDNGASDINKPRSMGIDAVFYKNCHEIGRPYRADGMSELIGSLYSGIVNTHLHNGLKKYNPHYEYGFIYGGLYVVGYCNWIYSKAKKEGIEKILFLSRDGEIYQRVFNKMFSDMPNEYVYWSRIANLKYTAEINRDDTLTRMTTHKAYNVIPATYREILTSFSLDSLIPELESAGIKADKVFTVEQIKTFEDFLIDNWSKIIELYKPETELMRKKISSIINNCKKVAVVDVGWAGSGPLGIKYLVEKKWNMNCNVSCYIAGSRDSLHSKPLNDLYNSKIEAYMFSRAYNRNHYDIHSNTNKFTNNVYFELFTQACNPSFKGISLEGDYLFDIPEVENYERIKDIHNGIADFAEKYISTINNDKYLLNISGYDAYCAFRIVLRDLTFIKKCFSDFSFARNVAGNDSVGRIETAGEIMEKAGL